MAEYSATRLAYIRTPDGVVKVVEGERVPSDALPASVDRLAAAGVIVEVETAPVEPDANLVAPPVTDKAPSKPRNRKTGAPAATVATTEA